MPPCAVLTGTLFSCTHAGYLLDPAIALARDSFCQQHSCTPKVRPVITLLLGEGAAGHTSTARRAQPAAALAGQHTHSTTRGRCPCPSCPAGQGASTTSRCRAAAGAVQAVPGHHGGRLPAAARGRAQRRRPRALGRACRVAAGAGAAAAGAGGRRGWRSMRRGGAPCLTQAPQAHPSACVAPCVLGSLHWCPLPRPDSTRVWPLLCSQVAELLLSVCDVEAFAAMLQDYRQAEAERAAGVCGVLSC
jgi:hypothetical protein